LRVFRCDSVRAVTKVAIIDDHEVLREGLEILLGDAGLEVVATAGNAAGAIDLIAVTHPDVAIVDMRLPDCTGIELTRELVARDPELGVLLYTGDSDTALLYEGLDTGARGYLMKSGSTPELVHAIEQVSGGGTFVDPRLDQVVAGQRAGGPTSQLSPREREVLHKMADGATAEAVADALGLSVETVRTHVRNAIRKLGARNRVHAIALALDRGEITVTADPE
jgi:DNA-binding NarL/FixJ family response regulator